MKIVNQTQWNTADLKHLFVEVCKRMGESTKRTIEVKNSRHRGYSGLGSMYRKWALVRIPVEEYVAGTPIGNYGVKTDGKFVTTDHPNSATIAQVLTHEIGHNQGLHHKDMVDCWKMDCSWANQFVINKAPTKPIIVRNLLAERQALADKKVILYSAKIKRMLKLLKKWQRKQKYYAKKVKK